METGLDICCVATLRPELLEKTLQSHIDGLFGWYTGHCRLIINIDLVGHKNEGDKTERINRIYEIVGALPFKEVDLSISNTCSFPRAFHRCVKKVQTPLFFYLEEDWELRKIFSIEKMMSYFEEDEKLVHLRLSAFKSQQDTMKNWNKFIPWNGSYFEVPQDLKGTIGWAGHPSLNRTEFIKDCQERMDHNKNPEKQIKGNNPWIKPLIDVSNFGVYHPPLCDPAVVDLGREWMKNNGWQKKGIKAFFTTWEKTK